MIINNNKKMLEEKFSDEKALEDYIVENLYTCLGLKYIDRQFNINNGEYIFDIVGYDEDNSSFVIIELKNTKNPYLFDQGVNYLRIMLENKAELVLKYNNKFKKNKDINSFNWEESRLIFISPEFKKEQIGSLNWIDLPIDLYKITKYKGNVVELNHIEKTGTAQLNTFSKGKNKRNSSSTISIIGKELKVYTEDTLLKEKKVNENIQDIYYDIRDRILDLGNIDIKVTKLYVAFKGNSNIADIEFRKEKLIVFINLKKGKLNDPFHLAKDISETGAHGNGDYCIEVSKKEDIKNVLELIKQSYQEHKK